MYASNHNLYSLPYTASFWISLQLGPLLSSPATLLLRYSQQTSSPLPLPPPAYHPLLPLPLLCHPLEGTLASLLYLCIYVVKLVYNNNKTMKSTKVKTLGIPTCARDIPTDDVYRRLHICGIVTCSYTINALSIRNIGYIRKLRLCHRPLVF